MRFDYAKRQLTEGHFQLVIWLHSGLEIAFIHVFFLCVRSARQQRQQFGGKVETQNQVLSLEFA